MHVLFSKASNQAKPVSDVDIVEKSKYMFFMKKERRGKRRNQSMTDRQAVVQIENFERERRSK